MIISEMCEKYIDMISEEFLNKYTPLMDKGDIFQENLGLICAKEIVIL